MKTNVKILVAALAAAGVVAPLQQAWADTITPVSPPGVVPPVAQTPTPPPGTTTSFPLTVTVPGRPSEVVTIKFDASTAEKWTATSSSGQTWAFDGILNQNANTAQFSTVQGGVTYSLAISSTQAGNVPPFGPATGSPAVTTSPSVGVDYNSPRPAAPVVSSVLGASTATGAIVGKGQTAAPLLGPTYASQVVGQPPPGQPPLVINSNGASTSSAAAGISPVGNANGAVTVTSSSPTQALNFGSYTASFSGDTTAAAPSVNGTVAGASGSMSSAGIFLNNITGTATYNGLTGVVTTSPVATPTFSVLPNGNTFIGGTLNVLGQTTTTGILNNGLLSTQTLGVSGNAFVGGTLTTNGISNSGLLGTQTLAVSGNGFVGGTLTTNGISNTGSLTTGNTVINGTANVTGAIAVGGNAILNGSVAVGGALGVTGSTTLNGATLIQNTLGVTGASTLNGATTIGSAGGTGGNTVVVNSSGIVLSTPGVGANNVTVNSSGTSITGGGATLAMANGTATFSGANATPIRVTGIADGQNQFDAVNKGQFDQLEKDMSRGVSGATALANIPQVDQGKQFALGVAVGGFNGETAFAIGGSARFAQNFVVKGGVGFAGGGGSNTVWGVGAGYNW